MFTKVLVANRGEIACRVMRTAKAMGYRTVAVFSDADANALHVQMADEAVHIGPSQVQQSYLRIDAIITACKKTGADAVHPGYGFLSENQQFSQACRDNGITFIGPDPYAIELMGSKRLAKIAMIKAGVPCVPGYEGEAQDDDTLLREARRIGFPVMIKASAGGGGRGMRQVNHENDFLAMVATARSEATNAFGSGELILEKAVIDPRHVEIQVFGDRHGHCIYLGERDCSIQRRHQKVVEESPCPVMTAELRKAMGEAAVNAALSCQYVGAGTVEFLLDKSGEFYFLEMNTRLQVEHPVTEMVTGLDLVEWQLRVAAHEKLPLSQEQVRLFGHAIEVRLYAEDPAQQFLPQTGTLVLWQPASGDGVRLDTGVQTGAEISPHYDPMIAKVIVHGKDRIEAARKLARAIEDTVVLGLNTNKRFLANIARHPAFIAGETDTGFIARHMTDDSALQTAVASTQEWLLAAVLLSSHTRHQALSGFVTLPGLAYAIKLRCGDSERLVHSSRNGAKIHIRLQDKDDVFETDVQVLSDNGHTIVWLMEGVRRSHCYALDAGILHLDAGNGSLAFSNVTHEVTLSAEAANDHRLLAPMDGAVVALLVENGSSVNKGQTVMIIEAMKIEHAIKANRDGIINHIHVQQGQQVKKKHLLAQID